MSLVNAQRNRLFELEARIAELEQQLADATASFKAACAEITLLETGDPYRRIDQLENSLSELVNHDAPAETVELRQKLADLRTDTLAAAQSFIDAYPESVFPPIPKELWPQIATVLKQIGISIDRVSASNMKRVANYIRDDINAAIERSQ